MEQSTPGSADHERNYGCRIREYLYEGIRHLSLENEQIKAVFLLDKGADMVELVYKPQDLDVLWRSFQKRRAVCGVGKEQDGGNFLDFYPGGWQELFPSYGAAVHYRGAALGVHGEVTLLPWDYEILQDAPEEISVRLSVRTVRTPYLLEKTVVLKTGEPAVSFFETVTNLGSTEQQFIWGHHPSYGPPFLEEGCYLELCGPVTGVTDKTDAGEKAPLALGRSFPFPQAPTKDGGVLDVSLVPAPTKRSAMAYLLKDFPQGAYRLVNPHRHLAVTLQWDKNRFPYLWVWAPYGGLEDYPWYGRTYNLAVEPWSAFPDNLEEAIARHTATVIAPGAAISTTLRIALEPTDPFFLRESGNVHVSAEPSKEVSV